MLTQVETVARLDVQAIPTPTVFTHIVTLRNRISGDEQTLEIETLSERFVDVMREVCHQRVMRGLIGYEVCKLPRTKVTGLST
jgi:hypothetical protein